MTTRERQRSQRVAKPRLAAVVDDDPFASELLRRTLEDLGYRVLSFDNPWSALRGIPGAGVDLAILDREMPSCSGPSLALRLRDRWGGGGPPLLLATGAPERLTAEMKAPFAAVLRKPLRPAALERVLARLTTRRAPSQPPEGCGVYMHVTPREAPRPAEASGAYRIIEGRGRTG